MLLFLEFSLILFTVVTTCLSSLLFPHTKSKRTIIDAERPKKTHCHIESPSTMPVEICQDEEDLIIVKSEEKEKESITTSSCGEVEKTLIDATLKIVETQIDSSVNVEDSEEKDDSEDGLIVVVKSQEKERSADDKNNCGGIKVVDVEDGYCSTERLIDFDEEESERLRSDEKDESADGLIVVFKLEEKETRAEASDDKNCETRVVDTEIVNVEDNDERLIEFDDDWGWEGIKSTDLEKRFGEAVVYLASKSKRNANGNRISSGLGRDVKIKLFALHKIATEGPCNRPQPMAFNVSARAKWNAWRMLGNMDAEIAMEEYIALLTVEVPEWRRMQG